MLVRVCYGAIRWLQRLIVCVCECVIVEGKSIDKMWVVKERGTIAVIGKYRQGRYVSGVTCR